MCPRGLVARAADQSAEPRMPQGRAADREFKSRRGLSFFIENITQK